MKSIPYNSFLIFILWVKHGVHSFSNALVHTSTTTGSFAHIHYVRRSCKSTSKFQLFANTDGNTGEQQQQTSEATKLFPDDENVQILEFTLPEHKPLGCTAEESLDATRHTDLLQPPVFIVSIKDEGNAQIAGLQVGDVILELSSGMYCNTCTSKQSTSTDDNDENENANDKIDLPRRQAMEDVHGMGLERVKALVAGTNYDDDDALIIKVARGSSIMKRHEEALMKLCEIDSSAEDKQFEGYISSFLEGGMIDSDEEDGSAVGKECDLEDEECIMNVMCDLWGEECEVLGTKNHIAEKKKEMKKKEEAKEEEKPKRSGYFSRSSPSGTYTRDPKTGKLENVDVQ